MNKHLLLAGFFLMLPLSAAEAAIYAGLDFNAGSTNLNSSAPELLPEATLGESVHIGDHFRNFAVELGYGTVRNTLQQTSVRFNRLTGDGLAYVPIGGFLNLIVTAGMSETNFGASNYTHMPYTSDGIIKEVRISTTLLNGDELDWRGGTGFSFSFGNGYEFHVIGRYEPLTMKGLSDYALTVDTGFNIEF